LGKPSPTGLESTRTAQSQYNQPKWPRGNERAKLGK
jgi:hypothetical protein